jgi:hypothetical protein
VRRAWATFLLLIGGDLILVSLYLPWQKASGSTVTGYFDNNGGPTAGLPDLFSGTAVSIDGWSSGVGPAAALFALLLVGAVIAALARPHLALRLPLGQCALVAAYFGIAVGVDIRTLGGIYGRQGIDLRFAYGAYVGLAGVIVALLGAGLLAWREHASYRPIGRHALVVPVVGVLVALTLPWEFSSTGIANRAAVVAAVLMLRLLVVAWRADPGQSGERLALAAAGALFIGAAFSTSSFFGSHAYGAWIALCFAVAAVVVALKDASVWRVPRPTWPALATCGAAGILVVGLFLPWQRSCFEKGLDLGPYTGRCVSTNGWTGTVGTASGALAIALVLSTLAPRRLAASAVGLAAGVALLIATLGSDLLDGTGPGVHYEFGYGSTVGFAGAALLVAVTLAQLRPPAIEWSRVPARVAPLVACAGYLLIVVLPWWGVLPRRFVLVIRFAPLSWLTVVGALLGIRLLHSWARRVTRPAASAESLVILPLALLALAAVDLVRLRDAGLGWRGGIVVGLCLLLAALGAIEQRAGLQHLRVPEILRVDRL